MRDFECEAMRTRPKGCSGGSITVNLKIMGNTIPLTLDQARTLSLVLEEGVKEGLDMYEQVLEENERDEQTIKRRKTG